MIVRKVAMAYSKSKIVVPTLLYDFTPDNIEQLDAAFDILFEETIERFGFLTIEDN